MEETGGGGGGGGRKEGRSLACSESKVLETGLRPGGQREVTQGPTGRGPENHKQGQGSFFSSAFFKNRDKRLAWLRSSVLESDWPGVSVSCTGRGPREPGQLTSLLCASVLQLGNGTTLVGNARAALRHRGVKTGGPTTVVIDGGSLC